jgi:hypothetical protein
MLGVERRNEAGESAIEGIPVVQRQALSGQREGDIDYILWVHSSLLVVPPKLCRDAFMTGDCLREAPYRRGVTSTVTYHRWSLGKCEAVVVRLLDRPRESRQTSHGIARLSHAVNDSVLTTGAT